MIALWNLPSARVKKEKGSSETASFMVCLTKTIFFFFNGLCHTKLDWELSSLFNYARQRNIKCQCNFRPPNGLHAFYISNQQRQINGVGSKNKFFLFNSLSFRVCLHGAFSTGNRNGFLGRIIFHCSMLSFSSFHFPVII